MNIQWTHCYTMRPYFRNVGLSVALIGGGNTIFSLIAWRSQPPNDPINMPVIIAISLLFTALGVYLLVLHAKYRMWVGHSTIRQVGVFRDQQVNLNAVDELKWRRFPQDGSIVMTEGMNRLKVEFSNFAPADRRNIIAVLRQSVAEFQQIGWQQFDEQFSDTPEKARQATRSHFLLVCFFAAHSIAFGIMWAIGARTLYLVISGVYAMMAAHMLWSRRRKRTNPWAAIPEHLGPRSSGPQV